MSKTVPVPLVIQVIVRGIYVFPTLYPDDTRVTIIRLFVLIVWCYTFFGPD